VVKGGGGGPRGAATTEALAKAGIAAVVSGDASAYADLTTVGMMASMLECKFPSDADDSDLRPYAKIVVGRSKGAKLTVKSVEPKDEKPFTLEPGKQIVGSCKLTKAFTVQSFTVHLAEGSDKDELTMSAMKVGDRWYLAGFDELPKTKDTDGKGDAEAEKLVADLSTKRAKRFRGEAGSTAAAVVKNVIEAAVFHSKERAEAVHIGEDELKEAVCSDAGDVADQVERSLSSLREFARNNDSDEGSDMSRHGEVVTIKAVTLQDSGKVAAKDDFRGCTTKAGFDWADVKVDVEADGKPHELHAVAIKLDGTWRVLYVKG